MADESISKPVGIIVCENEESFGGGDGIGTSTIKLFRRRNNEDWRYFKALSLELPDVADIHKYKAFILTGSRSSVNDHCEWISTLRDFVNNVISYQNSVQNPPKLFGICFGHQLINKILGANVVRNKSERFTLSLCDISASEELLQKHYYRKVFDNAQSFTIYEIHGEEVVDIPTAVKRLGWSENCQNEILASGKHILTMQGHMDINDVDIIEKIMPGCLSNKKIDEQGRRSFLTSLAVKKNDTARVLDMVRAFIEID